MISRKNYLTIIKKSLELNETKFAREATLNWLAAYPGDLEAGLLYARTLLQDGKSTRAIPILQSLAETDPENLEVVESLRECLVKTNSNNSGPLAYFNSLRYALMGKVENGASVDEWGISLWEARKGLISGQISTGLEILEGLLANPQSPLVPITYLRLKEQELKPTLDSNLKLLEDFHKRWPHCLFISLKLADSLMFWGDHTRAMSLLHQAVTRDTMAQVATRLWGRNHRYQNLWPDNLQLALESPIPVSIITALGWNSLPAGDRSSQINLSSTQDNALIDEKENIEEANSPQAGEDISNVQDNVNETKMLQTSNDRMPVYVILSIKKSLEEKFGSETAALIIEKASELVQAMNQMTGWKSLLLLADDPTSSNLPQMKPARVNDPWSIKLSLVDLENSLASIGQRIGAVLIVGGPDIVPFHKLPNPVEDPDDTVFSDNPYSTLDENYFIPEWPLGRLPDGVKTNRGTEPASPKLLIDLLQQIKDRAHAQTQCAINPKNMLQPFRRWFSNHQTRSLTTFGYSAAVWSSVSGTVFASIGRGKNLVNSPPHGRYYIPTPKQPKNWLRIFTPKSALPYRFKSPPKLKACLAYFNLHGLEDASDWFGQRDPNSKDNAPDYPVALSINDITQQTRPGKDAIPQIVFSEACYGAHIQNKSTEEAISIKLLSAGSKVVIGSTCMSYGSISTPLIAADLLAHSFWIFIREGITVGEALQRAKIHMTQTMHARHGHLDGEDQKTLISFVLYGDPLAIPTTIHKCPQPPRRPSADLKKLKTISDDFGLDEIPVDLLVYVKKVVSRYLPGMADAKYIYRIEEIRTINNHKNLEQSSRKPALGETKFQRITLTKQLTRANHIHNQVAHLTFTPKGKLIKLVISR